MPTQSVTFILIQKVVSKTKRTSSGLRDRIIHDWQELLDEFETHHKTFDLITTSINNALRRSLLKDIQSRHYIDERSLDYQNNVWGYNAD
jgi:hypothetical protein